MTATRGTAYLWQDLDWLQGASADGGFVHSTSARFDELEAGNLVRHTYRRTAVDGTPIDETGWWVVDRCQPRIPGYLAVAHLLNLATGTADGRAFTDYETVEVRTDTRVELDARAVTS